MLWPSSAVPAAVACSTTGSAATSSPANASGTATVDPLESSAVALAFPLPAARAATAAAGPVNRIHVANSEASCTWRTASANEVGAAAPGGHQTTASAPAPVNSGAGCFESTTSSENRRETCASAELAMVHPLAGDDETKTGADSSACVRTRHADAPEFGSNDDAAIGLPATSLTNCGPLSRMANHVLDRASDALPRVTTRDGVPAPRNRPGATANAASSVSSASLDFSGSTAFACSTVSTLGGRA